MLNDTCGHLVDVRILGRSADVTRKSLREGDLPVRYRGEEFLIILPGASWADSARLGERVRNTIAETVVKDGAQLIKFTASVGRHVFSGRLCGA